MRAEAFGRPSRTLQQAAREGWRWRGSIWGVVLAIHMGLVALVFGPTATRHATVTPPDTFRLKVRFIELSSPPAPAPVQPVKTPVRPVAPRRSSLVRARSSVPDQLANAPAAPKAPPSRPTQITWTPTPQAQAYVPGGNLFRSAVSMGLPKVQLPGGQHIKGAPKLHMVDPQSQGWAGVVRIIGSFTGAVDKHCLDLDAWQGMTPQERVKNHVSDDDMERVQENYNCAAARTRPVGAWPRR